MTTDVADRSSVRTMSVAVRGQRQGGQELVQTRWWCAHCEAPLTQETIWTHTCDAAALADASWSRFWRRHGRTARGQHTPPVAVIS